MRLRHLLCCLLLLLAALPASASATAWTGLGGGPGRSGHDAFDHGATTNVVDAWSQTATAEQDVVTGPVISDGVFSAQRVVYGTALDALHVQMLSTGMEVGPQAGTGIDEGGVIDSDTFGAGDAVISPVIAGSPSAPGQVYALHNDENQGGANDIALAQIDLATGALVQDLPVPNTDTYEIQSSPVLTEPDAGGEASLFFVASDGVTPRLFRLDISDVRTTSADFAVTASWTSVAAANTQASPGLVYLRNSAGTPTLYVAVGTGGSNFLETYAVSDFAAGPQASGVSGTGQTPSVPLTSDGLLPGAPGSGMDTSPWIYMAAEESVVNRVHRLEQFGNSDTLDVVSSAYLDGVPASALAVSKRVGHDPAEGVVAYTTGSDLYVLDPGDLSVRGEYSPTGTADFGSTTAALSDELVFAMLDDGEQTVLRTTNAGVVGSTEFTENSSNTPSTLAKGQPALAGGRVIFASDLGAFAYSTRDGLPPRVGNLRPASVLGGAVLEADAVDARGIREVQFRIDGVPVVTAVNPVSGLSHTPGGGHFIHGWDAGGTAPGPHILEARAVDNGGQSSVARSTIFVQPHTFADTDPPETTIVSGPRGRTSDTTPRFRFESSESPAMFECALDGPRFRPCPSRYELALVAGRHGLRVRAVDAAGNVDQSPSLRFFTIRAPGAIEVVSLDPIELTRRGRLPVPVTCHSRGRCRGVLRLDLIVPRAKKGSRHAVASRKGRKLRLGRSRFSMTPRTRRRVLVRASTTGRRLIRRHDRLRALASVRLNTPTGLETTTWPLTLSSKDG
jgi:outer membrane protein assembly factor BamB